MMIKKDTTKQERQGLMPSWGQITWGLGILGMTLISYFNKWADNAKEISDLKIADIQIRNDAIALTKDVDRIFYMIDEKNHK